MRGLMVVLVALGGWGCGQDAVELADDLAPGMEPEPEEGVDPPELPQAEAFADGVFRGAGSVHVQLSGAGAAAESLTIEVELLDIDGALIDRLTAPVTPRTRRDIGSFGTSNVVATLEEGEWAVQAWWPGDWAATRARTRLLERDQVLRADEWALAEVPVVDGECDPMGVASRCAEGLTCSLLPRPVVGQCFDSTLTVWRGAMGETLEFIPGDGDYGTTLLSLAEDGEVSPLEERFAPIRHPVEAPGDTFAVYGSGHRIDVEVRDPVVLDDGAACDREGVSDRCVGDLVCGAEAVCKGSTAPSITAAAYNWGRVWATVHLRGFDAEADLAAVELSEGDRVETYPIDAWRSIPSSQWHIGYEWGDDDELNLIWAIDSRRGDFMAEVDVVLIDTEGNRSEPVRADRGFLPGRDGNTFLPEGVLCDGFQSGMVGTCEGRRCGLVDGETTYRCLPAVEGCDAPERFEALDAFPAEVAMERGVNETRLLCSASGGGGIDKGFVYTAAEEGLHTITVRGEALVGIDLRQVCDRVGADTLSSACSGAEDMVQELSLEVWMPAGEQRYLVVEAFWASELTITADVRPVVAP